MFDTDANLEVCTKCGNTENVEGHLTAERGLQDAGGGRKQTSGTVMAHEKATGLSRDLKASMGRRTFPVSEPVVVLRASIGRRSFPVLV